MLHFQRAGRQADTRLCSGDYRSFLLLSTEKLVQESWAEICFMAKQKKSTHGFYIFIFFEVTKPEAFQNTRPNAEKAVFQQLPPSKTKLYAVQNRKR